jgi:hypothetical protein
MIGLNYIIHSIVLFTSFHDIPDIISGRRSQSQAQKAAEEPPPYNQAK